MRASTRAAAAVAILTCATAAARASSSAVAALNGSVAYLRCGDVNVTTGVCAPGSVQLAALDLRSGDVSLLVAFPNASVDTLDLQAIALAPASGVLVLSLASAAAGVSGAQRDGPAAAATGELVAYSLRKRAVVARVPAPACAFLAVDDDAPAPALPGSVLCLTDAPWYGVDGSAYLLRVNASTGEHAELASWAGSPVPDDAVAVLDPAAGVLYAQLLDEAAGTVLTLGWNATTGEVASSVTVPPTMAYAAAVWDPATRRVLGVVDDYAAGVRELAALDLATGGVAPIGRQPGALQNFTTVYGTASAAPAAGAVLVTALAGEDSLRLVGVTTAAGTLAYDAAAPADFVGSYVYVGDALGGPP